MTLPSSQRERWIKLVHAFRRCPVAVAADLVADEFIYGDISRVSREAPVLILEEARRVHAPGGGGNAVANLRSLGAKPIPVGILGRDDAGDRVLEAFRESGVSTTGIVRRAEYQTPTKSRILAGGVHTRRQQIVRIDRGQVKGELSPDLQRSIGDRLERAISKAPGLLIADYHYGAASPVWLAPRLRKNPPQVITVDSRERIEAFKRISACTPNQEELENASGGIPLSDRNALRRAAKGFLQTSRNDALLVTLGARGMALFEKGQRPKEIAAYGSDEVADVTGAGDTVIAAYTLALVAGGTHYDAARLANYAAGIVVQKAGTATVDPDELIQAIIEDDDA